MLAIIFIAFASLFASGEPLIEEQTSDQGQTTNSGAATRGTFAPVLYSEKRAITKGGFVKGGPVIFRNIAEKAGLTGWTHTMGTSQNNYILETTGSGVALLDYDNDGWLDIYMVNGSTVEALNGIVAAPFPMLSPSCDGSYVLIPNMRWPGTGLAMLISVNKIASWQFQACSALCGWIPITAGR